AVMIVELDLAQARKHHLREAGEVLAAVVRGIEPGVQRRAAEGIEAALPEGRVLADPSAQPVEGLLRTGDAVARLEMIADEENDVSQPTAPAQPGVGARGR